MLLEKRKEQVFVPPIEPKKAAPRLKATAWLFAATVVFGVLAVCASFFAGNDLNSVKERLEAGIAEGDKQEICADLKALGYLIADCEKMPEADLRELVKNLGTQKAIDITEVAKRFGVSEKDFHLKTKRDIKFKYLKKNKNWTVTNPDIQFTQKPRFLVFVDKQTNSKKALYTNVTLDSLLKTFAK